MAKVFKAGLIGCGDYLRWEVDPLNNSSHVKVKYTFDLDKKKAQKRAFELNAAMVDDVDTIFMDDEIEIVLIFTPPWARYELFKKAVAHKKHIISTKPLAPNLGDARKIFDLVGDKVACAVLYGRSGDASVEQLKSIFEIGEIGKLALYKEDWFHHYPTWNDWALDPEKNGGPFMDAMIHNLNKSRYLIGDEVESVNFISDNLSHKGVIKCNDTDYMHVKFRNGAASHLFITWAADLDVYNPAGNDREHYGIQHMITDKGWYVEVIEKSGEQYVKAHKEQIVKEWKVDKYPNQYDEVALSIIGNKPMNYSLKMALEDIEILDWAVNG